MLVDCQKFSETIDRVATISNEKFRTVKFQIKEDLCIVSSSGSDKSSGTESIKVQYNGRDKLNLSKIYTRCSFFNKGGHGKLQLFKKYFPNCSY